MEETDKEDQIEAERHLHRLLEKELNGDGKPPVEFKIGSGESGEPRVTEISRSHLGLALSGGGIRSATFGLGVLQGLARRRILKRLNYLSTVSGGGYIGGFWTAWRHRQPLPPPEPEKQTNDQRHEFPMNSPRGNDRPPIRHVREFSNFLAPRPGIFSKEGSKLTLAFVGLMLPTLILANVLLGAGAAVAACAHAFAMWMLGEELNPIVAWLRSYNLLSMLPGLAILVLGLVILLCRISYQSAFSRRTTPPGSHPATRVIFMLGLGWLFFTAIAAITENIQGIFRQTAQLTETSAVVAAVASWWFARRRHQILVAAIQGLGSNQKKKERADALLTALPAIVVIFGTCALYSLVDRTLLFVPDYPTKVILSGSIAGGLLLVAWIAWHAFHPSVISMHEFYRARIATSFLRASRRGNRPEHRGRNEFNPRETNEYPEDDICLSDMAAKQDASEGNPLHLICCTANDLSGDRLKNLGYGAKSAVLSCHGLWAASRHREWEKNENLHLSSALTASAAAFNSQMGLFSAATGPGLGFLMSALNFRLGLWARSPRFPTKNADRQRPLPAKDVFGVPRNSTLRVDSPGRYFYREMFSRSNAFKDAYVHLSDGGHFENLGLYELIRRQCRYIIVCDADTDPRAVSTNLGRAIRRVRSDFGVAIEIETAPLTADDQNLAAQHVVTGRIRYGNGQTGILYYLRANITGDEPADVLHYRSDHPDFPYQSTADQFYDESQWEAYRMLGEHIALEAFDFVERVHRPKEKTEAYWADVFNTGLWLWRQPSQEIHERLAACNRRREQLAAEMEERAPNSLLVRFSPEAAEALDITVSDIPTADEVALEFKWIHRIVIFMEGIWQELDFSHHEDFPALNGWYNYFARWAKVPSFQIAWPILRTMFDYEFISFVEGLRSGRCDTEIQVKLSGRNGCYRARFSCLVEIDNHETYAFHLGDLLKLEIRDDVAEWQCYDFRMNDSLRGVGYGRRCLAALIENLKFSSAKKRRAKRFRVNLVYPPEDSGMAYSLSSVVGLYQELGFSPEMRQSSGYYHYE